MLRSHWDENILQSGWSSQSFKLQQRPVRMVSHLVHPPQKNVKLRLKGVRVRGASVFRAKIEIKVKIELAWQAWTLFFVFLLDCLAPTPLTEKIRKMCDYLSSQFIFALDFEFRLQFTTNFQVVEKSRGWLRFQWFLDRIDSVDTSIFSKKLNEATNERTNH